MSFQDALAQFQRGDGAGAERTLDELLSRDAKHGQALQLLSAVRHGRGDVSGALEALERAATLSPNDAGLAFNRAAMLSALGRHAETLDAVAVVLRAAPQDAEALLLKGAALSGTGDYAGALASFEAASLNRADAHAHRANALNALERYSDALVAVGQSLAHDPTSVDAHYQRGVALNGLDRPAEALWSFDVVLSHREDTTVRAARALALANTGRVDEALADIDAALALAPDNADYLMRRAYVLMAMDRSAEAIVAYDHVLMQRPDDADAVYGKADALLSLGDFERGLELYEARWRLKSAQPMARSSAPPWHGEDVRGKKLLLLAEQGFGDLFQFCRFAPALAARGAHVIVQERPQTLELLRSLRGVERVVSIRDPSPEADFHAHIAGVMRILDVRADTIPAQIPYLRADTARVEDWHRRLPPTLRRRIGIAWSGLGLNAAQARRSLDETALRQLIGADADFVSLQLEPNALLSEAGVLQFGEALRDFADVAALIETLDLVISIDTGVAHLAGALGQPVWIMLPYRADWRWLREREDTPWYPQARLWRQTAPGDWSDVIARVRAAL